MRNRPWRATALRSLVGGLWLAAAVAAGQAEPAAVLETVEVRVVNVDVVVSDAGGRPVRGLERGDFELVVDGRPVPLDYFAAIVGGRTAGSEAGAGEGGAEAPAALPYLAIVQNGRGAQPASARRAADSLAARLDGLLANSRSVMVLRQGTRLVVEQPMTRDRGLLAAALERLGVSRTPALDAADRRLMLLQLETSDPPPIATESVDELMADRARRLLGEIRNQAEIERLGAEETNRQLRSVVRSMAGLPGRKAILLLGPGFSERPAEPLFRLWWSKFSRYASLVGVMNVEAEISRTSDDRLLERLIDEANARRVVFYGHDPEGLRTLGSTAEHGSLLANLEIAREADRAFDSLAALAHATGGVGPSRKIGLDTLLDEMLDGFGTYYSLGFIPGEAESGRVRVRLRQPGLRLRYLKQYALRTAAQELEEVTLATLLTAAENNRLQVAVEVGAAERQPDGTFVLPILVKVPMSRLTLLPRRAHHVGRLSFVVMAQSAGGGLSPPVSGEVPIEIANRELLSAMGRLAGYRLRLRVAAGEQVMAIGVRDEVAGQDATLRLVLAPGRDV